MWAVLLDVMIMPGNKTVADAVIEHSNVCVCALIGREMNEFAFYNSMLYIRNLAKDHLYYNIILTILYSLSLIRHLTNSHLCHVL